MSDYIDELVAKHFPCAGTGCRKDSHDEYCPASQRRKGTDLARAVAERVKAEARVCDCDEEQLGPDPDCPRCAGRVVSCWKPTRAEIDEIARTGRVWVQVLGDTMPPMSVEGVSPFTAAQGGGT